MRTLRRTEIKVPGKKNKVTKVITFIKTVSVFVLRAILCISMVSFSILNVDMLDWVATSLLCSSFW